MPGASTGLEIKLFQGYPVPSYLGDTIESFLLGNCSQQEVSTVEWDLRRGVGGG
jgi:hypothetical protein